MKPDSISFSSLNAPGRNQAPPPSKAPAGPASASPDSVQISGRTSPKEAAPLKKWTILQYSAADNNLTSAMVDDVKEMEKVGSDANTNLVVQLDVGGSKGANRYLLVKDDKGQAISSPVVQKMGNVNMSDPKKLADFIKWGMQNYPAQNYALILSDHGGGWEGAIQDVGSDGWMTMGDIKSALSEAQQATGKKIDVLGFDACLMASTEVGYELKDQAAYMVGSEETEGADGWPYTRILTAKVLERLQQTLKHKINMNPEELAKTVVKSAEGSQGELPTMAAFDMSKVDKLGKATDALAKAILDTDTSKSTLMGIARKTQDFSGFEDAFDFCQRIDQSKDIKDEKLKAAARDLLAAVQETVIAEQHSSAYPGAHGVTLDIPSGKPSAEYKKLDLSKDTQWDEAMGKIAG